MLALLLLNKPGAKLKAFPTLARLKEAANAPGVDRLLNTYLTSLVTGLAFTVLVLSIYHVAEGWAKQEVRDENDTARLAPEYLDNEIAIPLSTRLGWEYVGRDGLSDSTREQANAAIVSGARRWGQSFKLAFWEAFNYLIVFGVSTSVALLTLRARITEGRWHRPDANDAHSPPLLTCIGIGLLSYVLTTLAYVVVNFARLVLPVWTATRYPIFSSINIDGFITELPRLLLFPLVSFILAWWTCARLQVNGARPAETIASTRRGTSATLLGALVLGVTAVLLPFGVITLFAGLSQNALPTWPSGLTWPVVTSIALALLVTAVAIAKTSIGKFVRNITSRLAPMTLVSGWRNRGRFIADLRSAAALGAVVGLVNLVIRSALDTVNSGWLAIDVFLLPFIGFALAGLAFLSHDPLGDLSEPAPANQTPPAVLPVAASKKVFG